MGMPERTPWVLLACLLTSCSSPHAPKHPTAQVAGSDPSPDAGVAPPAADGGAQDSPIWLENQQPGVAHEQPDKPAHGEVEGYSSAVSAAPGETIQLFVHVDHAQDVRWDLYRVGYYGGLGSRLVARGDTRRVGMQPACPLDANTGMIACDWAAAFDVTIREDWVSGYYQFELVNEAGFGTRVPFVIKEGKRRAPALAQASVNTWQAYNTWGGTSLYINDHRDGPFQANRGYRVSFDRPYANQNGVTPFINMVRFLEQRGYDVSYTTNVDIDADASVLLDRKLVMIIAHDEYWTIAQRNALDMARDRGVSLGIFSGNTGYWRVRYEDSPAGVPRRSMRCHKSSALDPQSNAPDTTSMFSDHPFARPENALLGVLYRTWSKVPGFPFIVTNAEHWVFEGTGVKNRDALNTVVGPEWDGIADNGASPAGIESLTSAITLNNAGVFTSGEANTTVYYPTPHSLVFAGGTIDWAFGLADGRYADARVERMTENVLARAGLASKLPFTEAPPRPEPPALAGSKVLAGSGAAAQSDDAALKAAFGGPSGIAAGPDGKLYIVDRGARAVRVLSPDGQVSTLINGGFSRPNSIVLDEHGTLFVSDPGANQIIAIASDGSFAPYAGTGEDGSDDASDRLLAKFSAPRGLALGPDGALYVADNQNDAIRRIDASGVTTVATGLRLVSAVAVAADGAVYFSTIADGQIGVVRNGQVTLLANISGEPGSREGPAEDARLQPGEGLIVEHARLLFTDTQNNRVRALSLEGAHTITTLFGDGNAASDPSDSKHTYMPRAIVPYDGGYALADFGERRILWFKPEK
jgi:hypothetical protein